MSEANGPTVASIQSGAGDGFKLDTGSVADGQNRRPSLTGHLVVIIILAGLGLSLSWYMDEMRLASHRDNQVYAWLTRQNYQWAVAEGREDRPISPGWRLVSIEAGDYEASYTKGYWTPRRTLGLAVIKAVELGSKVVLIDFILEEDAPGDPLAEYIDLLEQAAAQARDRGAMLLMPIPTKPDGQYAIFLRQNSDVVKEALFSVNSRNQQLRNARLFALVEGRLVVNAALLSMLTQQWGGENFDKIWRDLEIMMLSKGEISQQGPLGSGMKSLLQPAAEGRDFLLSYRLLPPSMIDRHNNPYGLSDLELVKVGLDDLLTAEGQSDRCDVKDKITLIGSDYKLTGDYHSTPLGQMPGSYVLANMLNSMLAHRFAYQPGFGSNFVFIAFCLIWLFFYNYFRFRPILLLVTGLGLYALLISLFNHYQLYFNIWLFPILLILNRMIMESWRVVVEFKKGGLWVAIKSLVFKLEPEDLLAVTDDGLET